MKIKVLTFILIFFLSQILVWFQTYAQFKWEWFSKNTWLLILSSMPITYLWIIGVRIGMDVFDNKTWPLRFVGFCVGIIVFAIMSKFILGESMTPKTIMSLSLCFLIILIQFL